MNEYISFDCHKQYTLAEREDARSGHQQHIRIDHRPGMIKRALRDCEPATPVAVEATGNWYWIVDEIEAAGLIPKLVHPRKAKLMMGMINKTDRLDVHGLNLLQRNGTLPTVWIPPRDIRDLREITRTRMVMAQQRTRLKCRILATLNKYGLCPRGHSDPYGVKARKDLEEQLDNLPEHTRGTTVLLLQQLDFVQQQILDLERRLKALLDVTPAMQRLMTIPGVGLILAAVIALEVGDVSRFRSPERLASYAGTVCTTHPCQRSDDATRSWNIFMPH